MRIALAGNPNSGKTTMFNALTGRNERVGNWAGVTVEKKEFPIKKSFYSGAEELIAVDLPGAYSMSPFTAEESITSSYVRNERPDVLINIVDATNLSRSLFFTTQLLELGVPVVVALNKSDINEKRETTIDTAALSTQLGCPVVETVSTVTGDQGLAEVVKIAASLQGNVQAAPYSQGQVDLSSKEAVTAADRERFAFVNRIVSAVEKRKVFTSEPTVQDKVDDILTHPVFGLVIFAAVMFLVFDISQSTLGPWIADALVGWIEGFQETVAGMVETASPFLQALVVDGVVGGVGAVVLLSGQRGEVKIGSIEIVDDLLDHVFLCCCAGGRRGIGRQFDHRQLGFGTTEDGVLDLQTGGGQKTILRYRSIRRVIVGVDGSGGACIHQQDRTHGAHDGAKYQNEQVVKGLAGDVTDACAQENERHQRHEGKQDEGQCVPDDAGNVAAEVTHSLSAHLQHVADGKIRLEVVLAAELDAQKDVGYTQQRNGGDVACLVISVQRQQHGNDTASADGEQQHAGQSRTKECIGFIKQTQQALTVDDRKGIKCESQRHTDMRTLFGGCFRFHHNTSKVRCVDFARQYLLYWTLLTKAVTFCVIFVNS